MKQVPENGPDESEVSNHWIFHAIQRFGVGPSVLVLTLLAILYSVFVGIVLDLLFKATILWIDVLFCIMIPAFVAPIISYTIVHLLDELFKAEMRLRGLATQDGLTGLCTRRHFVDLAEWAMEKSRRNGQPVSVLMMDADYFKHINDTLGHAVGDRVLKALGRISHGECRTADLAGRYGGEEFAFLLPATPANTALAVAERLRRVVEAEVAHEAGLEKPVTVSIGVASSTGGKTGLAQLIDLADGALYQAKRAGRNRVCMAEAMETQ